MIFDFGVFLIGVGVGFVTASMMVMVMLSSGKDKK